MDSSTTSKLESAALALVAISTAAILTWTLYYCNYGLEFSDEGFYLAWLSNPFNYKISSTQFGFIYHPLYLMLDGNIAALRQLNIGILFSLSWALGNLLIKASLPPKTLTNTQRLIISAALASSCLLLLKTWLPTPNYNSLTLQALLITFIGLLLSESVSPKAKQIAPLIIGAGGWLTFMAKPTTAAALAVCICIYLTFNRRLTLKLILSSGAIAISLLFLSAIAIDGSASLFLSRLVNGAEAASILGGGYAVSEIFRIDDFQLSPLHQQIITGSALTAIAATLLSQSKHTGLRLSALGISVCMTAVILITILIPPSPLPISTHMGLLIWSAPLAAVITGVLLFRRNYIGNFSRDKWSLLALLIVTPHIYAFGTNGNYWYAGSNAAIFWLFGSILLLGPLNLCRAPLFALTSIALIAQLTTVSIINKSLDSPYRQPKNLQSYPTEIEVGNSNSQLTLHPSSAIYIQHATSASKAAGFTAGTAVIDLSGQSPGTLLTLGADIIVRAWTIGGYPGSDALAIKGLRSTPCHAIAAAWILTEPGGRREISADILQHVGINLTTDYTTAASFTAPAGISGDKADREQILLKPSRPANAAEQDCVNKKAQIVQ